MRENTACCLRPSHSRCAASLPQLPSSSKWGQQSTASTAASQSQSAQSLSEIQKLEEEREKLSREEVGKPFTVQQNIVSPSHREVIYE